MYDMPYHKAGNDEEIRTFLADHPFAFVTGCDAGGRPVATQLPVFLEQREERAFLVGHLMRGTDHHRAFQANPQVLVVFAGRHCYVSGSWYTNPHTPSTWNYMSVHVRGSMRFLGEDGVVRILQQTSRHFEGDDGASPTTFDNLPEQMTRRLVRAIVGFEVEVESMDSVFKLSQDRDATSYRNIIEQLEGGDADARSIAAEMARREAGLFPSGGGTGRSNP